MWYERQPVYTDFQRCCLMSIFAPLSGMTKRLTNRNGSIVAAEVIRADAYSTSRYRPVIIDQIQVPNCSLLCTCDLSRSHAVSNRIHYLLKTLFYFEDRLSLLYKKNFFKLCFTSYLLCFVIFIYYIFYYTASICTFDYT